MTLDARLDAARRGALFPLPDWRVFRCAGTDAADLLSRLSTNDLAPLERGQAVSTIFLSPTGRVLHRVLLVPGAAASLDALRAIAEPGSSESFPAWIDKYTFAEDCRVEPQPGLGVLLVTGPSGLALAPEPLASPGAVAGRDGLAWARRDLGATPAALVSGAAGDLEGLGARLEAAGLARLGPEELLQLRVENGEPATGHELTEDHFPLEAGLVHEVSFTKGCYTGQEVVARQDSYGKVTRRLVGLLFAVRPTEEPLSSEGKDGCRITSVAPRPVTLADGSEGFAALGYVAARRAAPGTRVQAASGAEGRVVELPLPLAGS